MRLHSVSTLSIPDLEPYRTLRERTWHWNRGFFVAEGGKVVRRLLDSTIQISSILLSHTWLERLRPDWRRTS